MNEKLAWRTPQEIRDEALEDAAKLLEDRAECLKKQPSSLGGDSSVCIGKIAECQERAEAIRALKGIYE